MPAVDISTAAKVAAATEQARADLFRESERISNTQAAIALSAAQQIAELSLWQIAIVEKMAALDAVQQRVLQ